MTRLKHLALFAATALILSTQAAAGPFDTVVGRDTRNYAPDPQVNFQNIALDLKMPDPMSKSFTCTETISFKLPGKPVTSLKLDAVGIDIKSVKGPGGDALPFRADDRTVTIDLPPQSPDSDYSVKFDYTVRNPKDGMIFALPDAAYPKRPLMIHTQGEAESNRNWFISHDYPNAKCPTEITVTIPSQYKALANGAMIEKKDAGNGMTTWHYKLAKPHVSYLVSLVIGDFAVVEDKWRDKPVQYWVPPDQQDRAARSFGKTPQMIELFSKLTGVDYPWEKYSQAVVYNFAAGGMENTSATTLTETATMDERSLLDGDMEGLVAHELGHQWFGDLITCRTWAHLWLNEGFATYMDALWQENGKSVDDYELALWRTMRNVAESDDPTARAGVVWPYYDGAEQTFGRPVSNPYGKGCSVLHMLRRSLGDELFFKCFSEYTRRLSYKNAETDDLRHVIEEVSGRSYDQFFQQWLYRAGSPSVSVDYDWNAEKKELRVSVEQKQAISDTAPAFDLDLPVWLVGADGTITKQTLPLHGRFGQLIIHCDTEPAQVCLDPQGAFLMKVESEIPTRLLAQQATSGPTMTARLKAVDLLATRDRDIARDALKTILLDDKAFYGLRNEAATTLGKMQQPDARKILLDAINAGIADARIRRSAIAALGTYRDEEVAGILRKFATKDAAYGVESAATAALADQAPTEDSIQVLLANTQKDSFRDQIRTAAVQALANLDEDRGFAPAIALATYGQPFRSRPTGVEAIGKLGQKPARKEEARKFLEPLTADSMDRVATAAINALGKLGDEKAIPTLKKIAEGSGEEGKRKAAQSAIDAINKKNGESATVRDLRERIEQLEKARKNIEKRLPAAQTEK